MQPLIVIGTRPEAIKLAPVALALPEAEVILTGQHQDDMVLPTLSWFGVPISHKRSHIAGCDLNQTFRLVHDYLTPRVAESSCVIAQGDTTTAAAAAMAAYYAGKPFVHVEAGLRTYESTPYPEEFNRRICALAASVHCCPTERAAENLRAERVGGRIEVTGNTVVDATVYSANRNDEYRPRRTFHGATTNGHVLQAPSHRRRYVLVTCHRRENAGESFNTVCEAVGRIAAAHPEFVFAWLAHPNPSFRPKYIPGVELLPPRSYPQTISMIQNAALVITDSGGIQEEAAILGKQCLVLRESTERPEAVECGACRLVGTDPDRIVAEASAVLRGEPWPIKPHSFGDGKSGERIAKIVRELTKD